MQAPTFSKATYTTLTLDPPPDYPRIDAPDAGVATRRTAGKKHTAYNKALQSDGIVLTWTEQNPLRITVYDGNYDYATRTQSSGQSLRNWFVNVAVGALNTFTYTDINGVARTVYIEGMDFKQYKSLGFVGSIALRSEY